MGTKYLIAILITLSSIPLNLFAASCCGGGASLPNLITGDYRAQFTINLSNSGVTHTTNDNGDFIRRDSSNLEVSETMTLMAAYQFSNLWQAGISIPVKKNTHSIADIEESSTGLGDIKGQIAYEFLPEYSYSKWKPRGFIFLQQTINDSKSTYDAKKNLSTDSFGSGGKYTSIGISFVKIISTMDFSFMSEFHHAPSEKIKKNNKNFRFFPGEGHSYLIGGGVSPKNGNLRIGGNILFSHTNSSWIKGDINSTSSVKEYLEGGLNLSYKHAEQSYIMSYTDQSFFGHAKNVNVSKALSISLVQSLDL